MRWHETFTNLTDRIDAAQSFADRQADTRAAILALSRVLVLVDRVEELGVDISLTRSCLSETYQDPDVLKLVRDVLSHEEDYVLGLGKEMPGAPWLGGFYMGGEGIAAFSIGDGKDVEVLMPRQALSAGLGVLFDEIQRAITQA